MTELTIKSYVEKFNLINTKIESVDSDVLIHDLYKLVISRFRTVISESDLKKIQMYQENVYQLVFDLREMDTSFIEKVILYIYHINSYLSDLIFMHWSLPLTSVYSERAYDDTYVKNIQLYNHKITALIQNEAVRSFCLDTISRTNSVQIHCMDWLWYYMDKLSINLTFVNNSAAKFISFIYDESIKTDKLEVEMRINANYLFKMKLGYVTYPDKKLSFVDFIKPLFTDISIARKIMTSPSAKMYINQLLSVQKNIKHYFGSETMSMTEDQILELMKHC